MKNAEYNILVLLTIILLDKFCIGLIGFIYTKYAVPGIRVYYTAYLRDVLINMSCYLLLPPPLQSYACYHMVYTLALMNERKN